MIVGRLYWRPSPLDIIICLLIWGDAIMRVLDHLSSDPSPPYRMTKAANDIQLAAFFIGNSMTYVAGVYSLKEVRLRGCASGI